MSVFAGEGLEKDFRKMLTASLLFHLLIFLPLFVISMKRSTIILYSPVYTVDLVEAPSKKRARKTEAKSRQSSQEAKKMSELKRKKEMAVLQKKLAQLQKRKTLDEQKVMAELQAKVAALKAKKSKKILDERVKKIESKLKDKEKTEKLIDDIQKKLAALKVSRNNRGGGTGKEDREKKDLQRGMPGREALLMSPAVKAYLNVLDETVRGAWNIPRALLDNREDLMVQLRITIEDDGGVSSIIVERTSRNRIFDDSVLRAINRAAPLPVPPESLREGKDYYDVGFRFHYFPEKRNGG